MRKLSARLRSHPISSVFLAMAALFLGAHYFLNWKAERRWQAYVREGRARGVKFDLTEFAPPKISDEENFAALPMMREIFAPDAKSPLTLPRENLPSLGNPLNGERLDWEEWQAYFKDENFIYDTSDSPPHDVLLALERYAPYFQQWSEWRTRPQCQFNLDLNAGSKLAMPHLALFPEAATLFALKLRAHLALGDSAAAYSDFREGFQAYRTLIHEPTLICGLVKINTLRTLTSAVGEGLADHRWSETELQKIEADLSTIRLWEDMNLSYSTERAFSVWFHEKLIASSVRERQVMLNEAFSPSKFFGERYVPLIPTRVYRDNQLRVDRYFSECLEKVSDDGTRFDLDKPTPSAKRHLSGIAIPYFFILGLMDLYYTAMERRFVWMQTRIDQARTAIALERYRMAHDARPEQLNALVPKFAAAVPLDIYSGNRMIYSPTEDGRFLIYSVGPDREDNGGTSTANLHEKDQPDWIWPYQ